MKTLRRNTNSDTVINLYTDGSYRNHQGSFAVDGYIGGKRVYSAIYDCKTTSSNETELVAVLHAMFFARTNNLHPVIHTDSKFVHDGAHGLIIKKKMLQLWDLLDNMHQHATITYVKGHDKCERNNLVDKKARNQLRTHFS